MSVFKTVAISLKTVFVCIPAAYSSGCKISPSESSEGHTCAATELDVTLITAIKNN